MTAQNLLALIIDHHPSPNACYSKTGVVCEEPDRTGDPKNSPRWNCDRVIQETCVSIGQFSTT